MPSVFTLIEVVGLLRGDLDTTFGCDVLVRNLESINYLVLPPLAPFATSVFVVSDFISSSWSGGNAPAAAAL